MTTPTLSGAQRGCVRPYREVPGGLWMETDSGLIQRPCALRVIRTSIGSACDDYARQYLSGRGDKNFLPGQLGACARFLRMHFALIEIPASADAKHIPLFDLPPLADEHGKLNPAAVAKLQLNDAADGQVDMLVREYELLTATETPDRGTISHAQWEAVVNEGKEQSLRTLHSRYGSSALIQVLHGIRAVPWPE